MAMLQVAACSRGLAEPAGAARVAVGRTICRIGPALHAATLTTAGGTHATGKLVALTNAVCLILSRCCALHASRFTCLVCRCKTRRSNVPGSDGGGSMGGGFGGMQNAGGAGMGLGLAGGIINPAMLGMLPAGMMGMLPNAAAMQGMLACWQYVRMYNVCTTSQPNPAHAHG